MVRAAALIILAWTALCAAPGNASDYHPAIDLLNSKKARSLTVEKAQSRIFVSDDEMEGSIQIDTEKVFREVGGILAAVAPASDDSYIRAFVNRSTGGTIFQIYSYHSNLDRSQRFIQANYLGETGLQTATVRTLDVTGSCGNGQLSGICSIEDTVVFDVPEETLRWAAAQYKSGSGGYLRFRLKSQIGSDWDDGVLFAEIAALLAEVDRRRPK